MNDPNATPEIIEDARLSMEEYRDYEKKPSWSQNNLEYDLRTSAVITTKAKASESYAQNIYAALCNNDFIKKDPWIILKEHYWSCSWRSAGGIVADLVGKGDYMDYYCSGINTDMSDEEFNQMTKQDQERYLIMKTEYVPEGYITPEVMKDLDSIGWKFFHGDFEDLEKENK